MNIYSLLFKKKKTYNYIYNWQLVGRIIFDWIVVEGHMTGLSLGFMDLTNAYYKSGKEALFCY